MGYTAQQRQHAAARERALAQQEERARAAVPEGHKPASSSLVTLPLAELGGVLRLTYADLERILQEPGLAGIVVTSAGWTHVLYVGGPLGVRAQNLRAWEVVPYFVGPDTRIELSSFRAKSVKLLPFIRERGWTPPPLPEVELDADGLPSMELPPFPFPNSTAERATPNIERRA